MLDYTGKAEPFTLSVTADGRKVRGVPRVFDVLDALGMRSASSEIKDAGDDLYQNYAVQRALVQKQMPALLAVNNYTTAYLAAIKANDYPTNSKNVRDFVNRRQLNSAAGAYTLLRHELAAYAKQSYTNVGRGLNQVEKPIRKTAPPTFVENAPQVFINLKKAVELILPMSQSALLAERGRKLAAALQVLSETAGKDQLPAAKAEILWKTIDEWALNDRQSAIVADIHTDLSSKQVLQIGIGSPQTVDITVGTQTASAAVFSTYEFRHPMQERLTDEQWRKNLSQPDRFEYRLFELTAKKLN